jgi:hypothetical protein
MPTQAPPTTGVANLDLAITATGFRISLNLQFDLTTIQGRIQHRHSDKLDGQAVRRYATMYKAGSVPPPIGVTRDGYVIWGNHRIEAALAAGFQFIPAIVVDVDGKGADEHLTWQLLSMSVAENAIHGVPYSGDDRHDRCRTLLNLGYTTPTIQRSLGLTAAQISGIRKEQEAELRLTSLGLPTFGKQNLRLAFASPAARALNDGPFSALATLANDAGLSSAEINDLAKSMKATGTDVDAMVLVDQVRVDAAQRIAEVAVGGVQRPTPVVKMTTALKAVINLCSTSSPTVFIDRTAKAGETQAMLADAIHCLESLAAVQVPVDEDEDEV